MNPLQKAVTISLQINVGESPSPSPVVKKMIRRGPSAEPGKGSMLRQYLLKDRNQVPFVRTATEPY